MLESKAKEPTQKQQKLTIRLSHANEQAKLILIASIPCLFVSNICFYLLTVPISLILFINIVLLIIITFAAATGHHKANNQIQIISNLIEAMIEGDYSLRGKQQNSPAFQHLLQLVNNLADTLHRHKINAQESQLLLEKIVNQMDAMVFAVDSKETLVLSNESAETLMSFNNAILQQLERAKTSTENLSNIIYIEAQHMSGEYFFYKDSFIFNNQTHRLYVLTRADNLLRQKEKQAWQNLLRVLSHELNNSLTPITTFSRTLLKKITISEPPLNVEQIKDGLQIIKERSQSLQQFIESYSQLSRLPTPNFTSFHWQTKLSQICTLFNECHFDFRLSRTFPPQQIIHADPKQLEQVFINILKNAQESMSASEEKLIIISAANKNGYLSLKIIDQGKGIANPDNLFIPFYTTKKSGSGIGLTLSRQIIENHNGMLSLKNRTDENGAEITIHLPLSQH